LAAAAGAAGFSAAAAEAAAFSTIPGAAAETPPFGVADALAFSADVVAGDVGSPAGDFAAPFGAAGSGKTGLLSFVSSGTAMPLFSTLQL
jgi:hypothetical protein